MPLLPRRFERLQAVLNRRMGDLTVVLEAVDKPHNLSAILRTCDAVGVLEAHVVSLPGRPRTFNKTAKGSQKWVPLHPHPSIEGCLQGLKDQGFRIFGTHLSVDARDYRDCDFTGPSCFLMGAEKWGMSDEALAMVADVYRAAGKLMDESGRRAGVADEGGWWPNFDSNEQALEMLAAQDCRHAILGCTEVSVAFGTERRWPGVVGRRASFN